MPKKAGMYLVTLLLSKAKCEPTAMRTKAVPKAMVMAGMEELDFMGGWIL